MSGGVSRGGEPDESPGVLHVVATPIGNLDDLTRRAERILREADRIVCEDTRHTRKLLRHIGASTRCLAYHEHNEESRLPELLIRLKRGEHLALVSDAGTPGISDPGFRLVRGARKMGIPIEAVPGPSASIAALSVSGLPTDRFLFLGFLPAKKKARRSAIESVAGESSTLIFYEAPHRLAKSLEDLSGILGGDRPAFLARELTKVHEEHVSLPLGLLQKEFAARDGVKGEITLVIAGRAKPGKARPETADLDRADVNALLARVEKLVAGGMKSMKAVKEVARDSGLAKSVVYDLVSGKNAG